MGWKESICVSINSLKLLTPLRGNLVFILNYDWLPAYQSWGVSSRLLYAHTPAPLLYSHLGHSFNIHLFMDIFSICQQLLLYIYSSPPVTGNTDMSTSVDQETPSRLGKDTVAVIWIAWRCDLGYYTWSLDHFSPALFCCSASQLP